MSPKSNSPIENRNRWAPLGGFVFLTTGATALVAEEKPEAKSEAKPKAEENPKADSAAKTESHDKPAAPQGEGEAGIVGTSTLEPVPVAPARYDWKALSVGAAAFFALSAFMCVLIFKIYANRKLV